MKVSVVMTTYNGSRFLTQMLESLYCQTRKIDELLIFDDQSTDDTVKIVEEFIKDNDLNNWRIIVNEKNMGWEKNFVNALGAATGDIIFPCDQDDVWHLDKIEKMANAFEKNDDIWLLVSGYHAFSENGGKMAIQNPVRTITADKISKVFFDEKYYQILRPGCTMAFRKELLNPFLENWTPGTPHDAVLWTVAMLLDKNYLYDETFIEYRRHDNNASKKISHGFKYKVNEIVRTKKINEWYKNSKYYNRKNENIIEMCNMWCRLRYKLLIEKRFTYWFKLFKYRKVYLNNKKYFGDIYYFATGKIKDIE